MNKTQILGKLLIGILSFCVIFLSSLGKSEAQDLTIPFEETLSGRVSKIVEEKNIESEGSHGGLKQILEIDVLDGSIKNRKITVDVGGEALVNQQKYAAGDEVLVTFTKGFEGEEIFYISDFVRYRSLFWLFLVFVVTVLLIGKLRGASSLFGMFLSFIVIFRYILPSISSGADPIGSAIKGSLVIIPLTFYLSHGFNKKTSIAIAGTLIALVITGFLARAFVESANLTGFASEEAGFLQVARQGAMNMKGLLLAGIIIGLLGVLDDITISQSAVVFQLKKANPLLKARELYSAAMNVGKDHIASMVNTLILVYTGASLPLLLLFIGNPKPFYLRVNFEPVAEEIVRTIVGSVGLILAVPITTFIASLFAKNE